LSATEDDADPQRVPSSGGVEVAVHDLGGDGPTLLFSHATGFHGRCYLPVAHELSKIDRRHSMAFDFRGHGDTPRPPGDIEWERYGDDAEAMAAWSSERDGGPIDAFGHSMGGACLLMAAHRQPSLFRRLVLFEPIVFPPSGIRPDGAPSPMVAAARKRRSTFHTFHAAFDNFASKPPLNAFTPEALHAYVDFGFARDRHGVHLKCSPDTEASTFEKGGSHETWEHLPSIQTEVLILAGQAGEMGPGAIAPQISERLPNARFLEMTQLDHFGPMVRPDIVARVIADALA